jgi:hypothetical protein
MPEFDRLLTAYREAVVNQAFGGPPVDGAWAYPHELEAAVQHATVALHAYVAQSSEAP